MSSQTVQAADSVPSSAHARGKVPDFLVRTFNIVSDPALAHIIGWTASGRSFIVHDVDALQSDVLGVHFKHSSFKSFHRQLNLYAFRKVSDPSTLEFAHDSFVRGSPELLQHISRARASVGAVASAVAGEVQATVRSLKRKRAELETELHQMVTEHSAMQARLDAAESEAAALRVDIDATKQASAVLNVQVQSLLAFVSAMSVVSPFTPRVSLDVPAGALSIEVPSSAKRRKLNSGAPLTDVMSPREFLSGFTAADK